MSRRLRTLAAVAVTAALLPFVPASAAAANPAPFLWITSPSRETVVPVGQPITIVGGSFESEGTRTTRSDVSLDGGATWAHFDHGGQWSLTHTPTEVGPLKVVTRAAWLDQWGDPRTYHVRVGPTTPPGPVTCPCTFTSPPKEGSPVFDVQEPYSPDLGFRFFVDRPGTLTGFTARLGPEVTWARGYLWDDNERLAYADMDLTTGQVTFSPGVRLAPYRPYTVSYHFSGPYYPVAENYFTERITQGPITAIHDDLGGAGVFGYSMSGFTDPPTQVYLDSNYLISPTFEPTP
ncbi:DUF4082 domain-containing protein [Actinokineospora globicatena]|uniref:DUF4082 domain-containing protein n=1 Tax=Actinokineospora globicatena TaxID=103729 RepID=UPI0020A5F04D|nr:DUF4082 domain-containing protein [Actinokineospora globicatena]MCP2303732.1 Mo-co oxidoreductase dimerization domain-containing protein [Actinokineospora globicatena]GLW79119.1 hypothetical protein Aglo01_36010 [Actinokineospora globicatena]GLW86471.1 hypothetical protein Aglo02_41100 [Actinokineospora globicatena]